MKKWIFAGLLLWWAFLLRAPSAREHAGMLLTSPGPALDDTSVDGEKVLPSVDFPYLMRQHHLRHLQYLGQDDGRELLSTFPRATAALARWLSCNLVPDNTYFGGAPPTDPYFRQLVDDFLKVARQGEAVDPNNAFFPAMAAEKEIEIGRRTTAISDLHRAVSLPVYDDYAEHFQKEVVWGLFGRRPVARGELLQLLWWHNLFGNSPQNVRPIAQIPDEVADLCRQVPSLSRGMKFPEEDFPQNVSGTQVGNPGEIFSIASLLVQLGKLQRSTAKTVETRHLGLQLENDAISTQFADDTSIDPQSNVSSEGEPNSPSLVSAAEKFHRADVRALALNEWHFLNSQQNGLDYLPIDSPDTDLGATWEADQLERIVLRTLPLCLCLLGLAALGSGLLRGARGNATVEFAAAAACLFLVMPLVELRATGLFLLDLLLGFWTFGPIAILLAILAHFFSTILKDRIKSCSRLVVPVGGGYCQGALFGFLGLGFLAEGSILVGFRSTAGTNGVPFPWHVLATWSNDWFGPGICAALPPVPWFSVGLGLLALALLITIIGEGAQPEVGRSQESQKRRERNALISFSGACRVFALIGLWLLPPVLFFAGCWTVYAKGSNYYYSGSPTIIPPLVNDWVPQWSWVIVVLMALAALLPWCLARFADRRAASVQALLQLQRMIIGYLFVATLLFAHIDARRVQHQSAFDTAVRRQLNDE